MNYEVLVVDDNLQAAKEFARLITVKAKLGAIATDDPDVAVSLLKSNPIKVALLDQRMPKRDGTALYRDLKKVDSLLKVIMLTGEAKGEEVGKALSLGFSDYIHKSEVDAITPRVLQHYCSYYTDVAEAEFSTSTSNLVYSFRRGVYWNRFSIDFFLISADLLDENFVPSKRWKTIVKIDAGEQTKRTISRQETSRLVIEEEEKDKLFANVSAKIPIVEGLTAKLEEAIEDRFKTTKFREISSTDSVERVFQLPNEPNDPIHIHIKSRQYEQAPVYQQIRLVIKKTCSCCNSVDFFVLIVNLLTPNIATRQIDFMSDGTSKITDTGYVLK